MKSRPSHVPDSKNKKNLILTILIAAAFVIAALPFIVPGEGSENNDAVTLAGPPGADEQWAFGYSSPDETNVSYGGGTYSWVMDTKTLTLNNVTHITGAATALSVPNGTTIELIGTNTIESEYDGTESTYGIFSGVFTITGSGSLYAAGGTSSSSVSCGIFSSIDISIDGPEVTATGGQAIYSVGISATSSISISDAVVTATGGRGATLSYGMNANNNDSIISINASVVIAAGGNDRVSGNSYGIFAGGEMIVGGNSAVEATGSNVVTGNLSYGIYLTTESSISITGGTLTAVGSSGAISEEYEVPDGHTYWVNTATSDPGGPGTESDGSDIITTEYKYAKIKARTCIDSVKIKGVTLPVGGASPQFGTLMVVGEGYTAEVQAWRDANGDEFTGSFVAGEEYTLWTELTAESGYIFADPMTGTINGSPADHDRTIGERTWFSITFVALDVPDTTPPVLSYGSANRTSDTAAAITFITTKPGTAYCLVQNSGGTAPSDADIMAGTPLGTVTMGENTKAVTLTAAANDIFVVVEDVSGNISEPFKIEAAAFVPVTDITGVPGTGTVGTEISFTGAVIEPGDATLRTVSWSVTGGTASGASIMGDQLTVTGPGTVIVKATVSNGLGATDYTKDLTITFSPAASPDDDDKGSNIVLIAVIAVAVIACVGAAVYLFVRRK